MTPIEFFEYVVIIPIAVILFGYLAIRVWSSAYFRSVREFISLKKKEGDN